MLKPEKHDDIIQAALELIAEHGFHGAPMAMIAERANVAAGTIYRYFESKDVLIVETHVHVRGQMLAAVLADYQEHAPVRERFLHMWRRLADFFLEFPLQFLFIEQFHNSPYGVACKRDISSGKMEKDVITCIFEEGRQQQIIKDLPLPILLALTFGPLVVICRDHVLQFIQLEDDLISRTAEACWDALKR